MILQFFDWNIMQPTAVTYIELYINAIISKEEFLMYNSQVTDGVMFTNLKAMKSAAITIALEFLDLSLTNTQIAVSSPSLLAASIVAATRYTLALDPAWPPNMSSITGYELDMLENLISQLFGIKSMGDVSPDVADKRKNTPDSGYLSSKETDTEDENDETHDLTLKRFKS